MVKINYIKIDYQINPIGITNKKPTFMWSYEGDNFYQRYYRILVATAKDKLLSNEADMWDSGIINSHQSSGIIYEGKELLSRTDYYYQIETDAGKSEIQTFETGLLNDGDWVADFIGAPVTRVGSALLIRKDFEIKDNLKVKKARIYLCGLGCHEFYVNGQKASKGILNPPVTDYNKTVLYDVYAFERLLKKGKNSLGIILGHGWLGSRKLLAQVYITYENGEELFFYTGSSMDWWITGSWIIENSIYDGEVVDGNLKKKLSSWCDPQEAIGWAHGWLYSLLIERPQGKLTKNILEPINEVERFKPVSENNLNGHLVFDFGQNIAGFASIKVRGDKNAKVTIKYGEQLDENGFVNQLNLRTALGRDIYILNGDGEEEYEPRFTYHGFQYVEVIIEGQASLKSIEAVMVRTAVKQTSLFECDNEIINKLHKNIVYTEGNNMHGVFTDCPQRDERFGWLNDLTARLYQNVLNYDIPNFLVKVTKDIKDTQDELGRIADTAPFVTAFRPADPVCLSYLLCGLQSYKYYGNKKLLLDSYKGYKAWVDYLSSMIDNKHFGLYNRFADWCPPEGFKNDEAPFSRITPAEFISLCFYYLHLKTIAKIARIIEKNDDFKTYEAMACDAKKNIVKKYYNKKEGRVATDSQACIAMALGLNLLDDEAKLTNHFNQTIIDKDYHVILGNQSYVYAFEALAKYGYVNTAIMTLTNPTYPGWGFMIANGATTIWERWEKDMQQQMHSFDHPMFGSIDAFFMHHLLGINISDDAIGADKIIIKPCFSNLINKVKGCFSTVNGDIKLEHKRNGDDIEIDLYLPPNTKAKIEIENLYKLNEKDIHMNLLEIVGGGHYVLKAHYKEEKR